MSKIEWTERTWNPIAGCTIVSPGCTNCYAMRVAARLEAMGVEKYRGLTRKSGGRDVWTGKIALDEKALLLPLKWRKPTRIFVNSMSDLFHEDVPDEWIDRVFAVMALSPQHTFQVLTKRAERMRGYLSGARARPVGLEAMVLTLEAYAMNRRSQVGAGVVLQGDIAHLKAWPLLNVWLGVSTEDQSLADERIPLLLKTPAAVHFISAEPLLGPLDLSRWVHQIPADNDGDRTGHAGGLASNINWLIVGGESCPGRRPVNLRWLWSIREQCKAANVPLFVKQIDKKIPIPDDLMIRQWPRKAMDESNGR